MGRERTYDEILREKEYYDFNRNKRENTEKKVLNELLNEESYKRVYAIHKDKTFHELIKEYRHIKRYNKNDYKLVFIIEFLIDETNYFNY